MDHDNPIVRLCVKGMEREGEGNFDQATLLFMEAWEKSTNDFEACIAAHYLARHQKTPSDSLRWNHESLNRAERVDDESVQGFYPSLYLNIGKAHEDLGNSEEARRFYELAAAKMDAVADGRYHDIVRDAITSGLARVAVTTRAENALI